MMSESHGFDLHEQRCPAQPNGMTCETCETNANDRCNIPKIISQLQAENERLTAKITELEADRDAKTQLLIDLSKNITMSPRRQCGGIGGQMVGCETWVIKLKIGGFALDRLEEYAALNSKREGE